MRLKPPKGPAKRQAREGKISSVFGLGREVEERGDSPRDAHVSLPQERGASAQALNSHMAGSTKLARARFENPEARSRERDELAPGPLGPVHGCLQDLAPRSLERVLGCNSLP